LIQQVLTHLAALVGFDTQNPPRRPDPAIFEYLRHALPDFEHTLTDHGEGSLSLLSVRGNPRVLFNVHIDTVPAAENYSADPLKLRIENERAIGLGACDIKGAAACMITAAAQTPGDAAFLFTSDEEAGQSTCVREFCKGRKHFEAVIVAEPTQAKAILEHRGILTARADFEGISGHASSGRADLDSALHHAVDWSHAVLTETRTAKEITYKNLHGLRFNLGRMEGGVKPNMVASSTFLNFGFRPLPGMDAPAYLAKLGALEPRPRQLERGFYGPPLPAPGFHPAEKLAENYGLPLGDPVDFWTEASLFSEAGYDALVFGPGNIAQAHAADEWVPLSDLASVTQHYTRILSK